MSGNGLRAEVRHTRWLVLHAPCHGFLYPNQGRASHDLWADAPAAGCPHGGSCGLQMILFGPAMALLLQETEQIHHQHYMMINVKQ